MNIENIISQIALPTIALIISSLSFYYTNRTNKKVNSKDYEISENLKYELLKLIAALRALDAKACLSPHIKTEIDYSQEIKIISELRTSPGYLVFLHSINNDEDRFWVDFNINYFSAVGNSMAMEDIRLLSNRLIDLLKNNTNLEKVLKLKVINLIKELCVMKGMSPEYKKEDNESDNSHNFKRLINILFNKGTNDLDVILFYGVLNNDVEIIKYANDNGANLKVSRSDIINKYKIEYEAIIKSNKIMENKL